MEYLNITTTKETVDLFFPKAFQKCLTDIIKKQTGNYYITDAFRDDRKIKSYKTG